MTASAFRLWLALSLAPLLASGAAAATADPSAPGPFTVGVTTLTLVASRLGRTFVTEVWYPATSAGRDTPRRAGRFPLVIMVHGACGSRLNYQYLTTDLAAHGFTVAAPDIPGFTQSTCDAGHADPGEVADAPEDMAFISSTFRSPDGPAAAFAPDVRRSRTGLVGHSLGGYDVVLAAASNPAYAAVVTLAPAVGAVNGATLAAAHGRRAVLVMGGSADTLISFQNLTLPFFEALASPAFLVRIAGGTHDGFTDSDSHLTPAQLARQEFLAERYAVAFFERYLAGRRPDGRFLTPADASAQGTDVTLTTK